MHVEQLYTNCLSQAAYYIASDGEAAVIDPMRDTQQYIDKAKERGETIKYVFETHVHADFTSGHLDLSQKTGAPIVYGPKAETGFDCHIAKDKENFQIGSLTITLLHTPGHTPESVCYLLKNKKGEPHAIFSGDTLFVGDVGRPDLAASNGITKEDLAGKMYTSLQEKILPLPDNVIVYPAHGAGSACGKNLGDKNWTTIGEQKESNYALQAESKEEFVDRVLEGLGDPPDYFPINVELNKSGYNSTEEVLEKTKNPIAPDKFENHQENGGYIVLDTRNPDQFETGFIPGSINIGLDGRYAEWVGTLLNHDQKVLLVSEEGRVEESLLRMARVGFENAHGYLKGGMKQWKAEDKPIDMVISIDPEEFRLDHKHDEEIVTVDVRTKSEFKDDHIDGAMNVPLSELRTQLPQFDTSDKLYVHCQSGYRSMIASSILKQNNLHHVRNIKGGYDALQDLEISRYRSVDVN